MNLSETSNKEHYEFVCMMTYPMVPMSAVFSFRNADNVQCDIIFNFYDNLAKFIQWEDAIRRVTPGDFKDKFTGKTMTENKEILDKLRKDSEELPIRKWMPPDPAMYKILGTGCP